MKVKLIALAVSAMTISGAWGHGYLMDPPSRAYQCKLGNNQECGNVTWEPQSVEQKSGFPDAALPYDGELASAGIPSFSQLNRQSADAWAKTSIKAGRQTFVWHHTAPHKTTNWRYYITKQGWDPNAALTRDAFELTPFCVIEGNGQAPAVETAHECDVPERTGYQAIYSVWEIADTANSFYQIADIVFAGDNPTQADPSDSWGRMLEGQMYGKNLRAGDKVKVRFFRADAELISFTTTLTITDELTDKNRWSKALAAAVNEKADAEKWGIRAGVKDAQGKIEPVFGTNKIYISSAPETLDPVRRLQSIAISYEESATNTNEQLEISELLTSKVQNGKSTLTFNLWTAGKWAVEAKVYDSIGTVKGYTKTALENVDGPISFDLDQVTADETYTLSLIATNEQGELIQAKPQQFTLQSATPEAEKPAADTVKYDETFPHNKSSYKSGTRVLQPKNGKVYQCKPFPYSGYCSQWSSSATQFEPGIGSHWQQAWIEK